MTTFAAKAQMNFEPAAAVDLGTVQVGHTTPAAWRHTMGGLSIINGVTAKCRYKLARNAGAADVTVNLSVKTSGGATLAVETVTVPAGASALGVFDVDVGAVSGGSPLLIEVDVTSNDAGTTATLNAVMEYETPVVIGGC